MMMNKKKVLILSGASYMIEVVETAKTMGLYTILTDNMVEAQAKKFADKSYDSSVSNIEALVQIAKKEQIDGVFNTFDDINTWHALALCKKTDLPIYTVSEQLRTPSGSHRFEEYCQTFNVPVIEVGVFDGLYEWEIAALGSPVKLPDWTPAKEALQVV
ncbi:hypothetical protein [Planomicrobium sp. CPCC 101110]|uniref:hypothetical protein n=1 Tax=Planomicrobium sp. CPCC 101110 TaxID=2599619 RepID=UPI0011B8C6A0|nr:hypothetical protein [Planomicrobium sp. CPCC 101110]TWT27313.1 hypothetical protein FQV30_02000 [Planomicrobium sp. CPCC 101110]